MQWSVEARNRLERHLDEVRQLYGAAGAARAAEARQRIEDALVRRGIEQVSEVTLLNVLAASPQGGIADGGPPPLPAQGGPPPLPEQAGPARLAGHVDRRSTREVSAQSSNAGCLRGALIGGGLFIASAAAWGWFMYYSVNEVMVSDRADCATNIGVLGDTLVGHAEDTGEFPPLAADEEPFLFGGAVLETLDKTRLRCPAGALDGETEAEILSDSDYIYLGYGVRNQEALDAYMDAYVQAGGEVDVFMQAESIPGGAGTIERLRPGLPDPATVPVLVEWEYYHLVGGAHVYYLDGHVEFIERNDRFPVTDAFYSAIRKGIDVREKRQCRENLLALYESIRAAAVDQEGVLPPLRADRHGFLFGGDVWEDIEPALAICPTNDFGGDWGMESLEMADYYYLGFAIRNMEEMEQFVAAFEENEASLDALSALTAIEGTAGALLRLRMDLPKADRIPVLIEEGGNHAGWGAHVLYLDGHVEYIEEDRRFPVQEAFYNALYDAKDYRHRVECRAQVETMGAALQAYSEKHGGKLPPLNRDHESYLFGDEAFTGLDKTLFRCPSAAYEGEEVEDILYDSDYLYLGFAVENQDDMEAIARYVEAAEGDWTALNAVDRISGPQGEVPRLQRDLPHPETIPVLIEWGGYHADSGGHVLYLDGHIEYLSMDESFPMTSAFFDSFYAGMEEPSYWSIFWEEFWREYSAAP